MTICGAVIARDEAANIERCLRSIAWTDGLLVVLDDRTVDGTAGLAASCGARVVTQKFVDYAHQRNAALGAAGADWVLFVDADEVVTPELAEEVRAIVQRPDAAPGYWIPRRNILFGHWIRHAGWSPDYQLRLLRAGRARYRLDKSVHELVDLDGKAGHLQQRLVHYNYSTVAQFCAKQRVYSTMEAADMFGRGVQVRPHNYVLQPWRQFWRRYVTLQGFKDGFLGLLLSSLLAYYEFRTYVTLASLWRDNSPLSPEGARSGSPGHRPGKEDPPNREP